MEIRCSRCGAVLHGEEQPLLNTARDPELKARVKDGSLFVRECPYCGTRNLVAFETLYHDPSARLMIWLLPDGKEAPTGVAEAVKQLEGYTLRRVSDAGSLIEKVNIFDAGLDDRLIEMCKWVTKMEMAEKEHRDDILETPFKFWRLEGADHEIVLSFPRDGQMQAVNIGFNVYEDARGILSRNPSVKADAGFAQVDARWLAQFFR